MYTCTLGTSNACYSLKDSTDITVLWVQTREDHY